MSESYWDGQSKILIHIYSQQSSWLKCYKLFTNFIKFTFQWFPNIATMQHHIAHISQYYENILQFNIEQWMSQDSFKY